MNFPPLETCTVAVIGLGYVGLPLALEFAKPRACVRSGAQLSRRVIGFDINNQRLEELRVRHDRTNETTAEELQAAEMLEFTSDPADLAQADVFVVTVPTPIDSTKRPDLRPLKKASTAVGRALRARAADGTTTVPLVIYESTVYPGATEEVCVPILEEESGMCFNEGFSCGYSPERINPGDTEHKLTTITKVTSGSTPGAAAWVDGFYGSIIKAGTHLAPSLRVAEAAKVIENIQRDLNIALVNELAIIFREVGIDTLDVLEAAGTKWNFLPFRPGLVGGHCIGVDPYYLTYKAQQLGHHCEVILAGRRINDGMARRVADETVRLMLHKGMPVLNSRVLVLGLTFKENCPDLRNSKVVDTIKHLKGYGIRVDVYDPWIEPAVAHQEYGLDCLREAPASGTYQAIVLAVGHRQFIELGSQGVKAFGVPRAVVFDIKGVLPQGSADARL